MAEADRDEKVHELDRLEGRPEPEVDPMLQLLTRPWPGQAPALRQVDAAAPADPRKAASTMQARAALRGYQLVESHMECGGVEYIVSKDSLTRAFSTLTEVNAWLDRVVGR
jgi:hypothetical protein